MQLYIANKNYSSWSMRPWVLMQHFGIAFEEVMVPFEGSGFGEAFMARLASVSPAGKVPVLLDGPLAVWDTLAIAETLAERHPQHALWPRDAAQRARARSLCAEMHAGFGALRNHCPMNIEADLAAVGQRVLAEQAAVVRDLQRISAMWTEALAASGGPFLFGEFGIVDAYYAPVVSRIRTYGLPLPDAAAAYAQRVWHSPGVAAWVQQALAEHRFVAFDEPYRQAPTTLATP
jgi:glutathione S-transferase